MANIIAAFCFGILFTMVILVMTAGLCWAASRGDDAWDGCTMVIKNGTGAGQSRTITVDRPFTKAEDDDER